MANDYSVVKAKLEKMFREPDGVLNSARMLEVLESGAKVPFANFISTIGNDAVVLQFVAPCDLLFKAGAADCAAEAGTAATGTPSMNVQTDGGSAWATVAWEAAGTTGAWTQAADETVSAGSVVTVTAPASADATLADLNITMVGHG